MEKLVEELQTTKPDHGTTPPQTSEPPSVSPLMPAATATVTPSVSASASQSPLSRRKASSASPSAGNPDSYPSPPSATSSSSTGARPFYVGAPNDQVVASAAPFGKYAMTIRRRTNRAPPAGACSLLSPQGIAQIELLIGDSRFTNALIANMARFKMIVTPPYLEHDQMNHPLPPNHVIMDCVNDYMVTMNQGIRLFQEHELRAALRSYFQGQPIPDPGWRMAVNSILAHSIRKKSNMRDKQEYEKYIHNALGMIPNVILRPPSPLTIGALLSVVLHFSFLSENHVALTILGLSVQLLLLAGYHREKPDVAFSDPNLNPTDHLHRKRLAWQALVIDRDLALRIGKPPLISDDFLLELPEEHPADGYSMYYYPNNVTLNFFLQQVRLAQIQGRILTALYSRSDMPPSELEAEIRRLDAELQEWRESIPEMIHPERVEALLDGDYHRLVCLTTLHFTYFQLVVAIHSAAFKLPALEDQEGMEMGDIGPSLALCVGASRAAVSLLSHHQKAHPFTPYLIYQVAWSVDVLFISILHNRKSARARRDLDLIRTVITFFEEFDPYHETVPSYQIIRIIAEVAATVLADTPTLPPHMLPISGSGPVYAPPGPQPQRSLASVSPVAAGLTPGSQVAGFPPDALMGGTPSASRSGSINGNTSDVLGPMTSLSMSDQQQQRPQGLMGMTGLVQPNEGPFFPGFMDMADWRLPMDYQPELWQYDNMLDGRYQNQN
ncbi:fungal specific transcription factor [Colletotrichum sojae]|uniref:Fungal specific transcription factor n=1 Tax=Colletotrichum sojae TaxID=2175907 RepID=A0A8H6IYC1_9PEZI|nr:fungal specific transcription factor [Colletotrichum sojae]